MSKKLDINAALVGRGSRYPSPYDEPCRDRMRYRLGDLAGLTQFGVNLTRLSPGAWSSQRHWHTREDEFVFIVEGEVVLITNAGEEVLRAGDTAGFKAGEDDGHQLCNRSDRDAVILEVGTRLPDEDQVFYSDIDMQLNDRSVGFVRRNGEPFTS
jgi:uncharacterized cupin superfamily protein